MGLYPHMKISRKQATISMKQSPGNYNYIQRKEYNSETALIRAAFEVTVGTVLPWQSSPY